MILYTVDHKCCTGTITFAFVVKSLNTQNMWYALITQYTDTMYFLPADYNILNVIKVLITLLTLNINC
jgi:hypothetical protein